MPVKKNRKFALTLLLALIVAVSLFAGLPTEAEAIHPGVTGIRIFGDGVEADVFIPLADLRNQEIWPWTEQDYSARNTYDTRIHLRADGIWLEDLLDYAGLKENATLITFGVADNLDAFFTLSLEYLLEVGKYHYPNILQDSAEDREKVRPMIAMEFADPFYGPLSDDGAPRLCFGQTNFTEQTFNDSAKHVISIEVTTVDPGQYNKPTASAPSGPLEQGTQISLQTDGGKGAKIYYTLDGSIPDKDSAIYNLSDWNPNLPITITGNIDDEITINAIVYGHLKRPSNVETFTYTITAGTKPLILLSTPTQAQIYYPEETVTISGTVLNIDGSIGLVITNPQGETVFSQSSVSLDFDGKFSVTYPLSSEAETGIYTVILSEFGGTATASVKFQVSENAVFNPMLNDGLRPDMILSGFDKTGAANSRVIQARILKGSGQTEMIAMPAADWNEELDGSGKMGNWSGITFSSPVLKDLDNEHSLAIWSLNALEPGPEERLAANTKYVAQVGKNGYWSAPFYFTTAQEEPSEPFSFMYLGDVQEGYGQWGRMIRNAYAAHPEVRLGLIGGDLVDSGVNNNEWQAFMAAASPVFSDVAMAPIPGNHDDTELFTTYLSGIFPGNSSTSAPASRDYYSFDYGNAHFTMLNTMRMGSPGIMTWLEADLAAAADQEWLFVVMHYSPYPVMGGGNYAYETLQEQLVPIFEEYGVDLAFVGHQHTYARTKPMKGGIIQSSPAEGIVYIMGNSGAKYYEAGEYNYIAQSTSLVSTYQIIDIEGNKLTFKCYDEKGSLIDGFVYEKKPLGGPDPLAFPESYYKPITVKWAEKGIDKTFSVEELRALPHVGPYVYSSHNSVGTFTPEDDVTGILFETFLTEAGIDLDWLAPNQQIAITPGDNPTGFMNFIWENLSEPRYTFDNTTGQQGSAGPTIINFINGDSSRSRDWQRLMFGQTYYQEANRTVYTGYVVGITIGGLTEPFAPPQPRVQKTYGGGLTGAAPDSAVVPGQQFYILPASGLNTSAAFYTTDGSEPTTASARFINNTNAEINPNNNQPITVPPDDGSGVFIVKAKTMGIGAAASETVTYTYYYSGEVPPVDTSALTTLVASAELLHEADYTAASWTAFAAALTQAQAVLAAADATQYDVNMAYSALIAARNALRESGELADYVLEVIDQRDGKNIKRMFTLQQLTALTDDTKYNYTTVNTFGSFINVNNAQGPKISDLFREDGISDIEDNTLIKFASPDGYTTSITYDYLISPRYYYPHATSSNVTKGQATGNSATDPVLVPPILNMKSDDGTLTIGQRYPNEQTNNVFAKYLASYNSYRDQIGQIIITDEKAGAFPAITVTTPANGTTVAIGDQITFQNWGFLLGYTDGYIHFTTGDTPAGTPDPDLTSTLYNYNTYNLASGDVLKPTVQRQSKLSTTFTVKVIVIGKGKLPSEVKTFTYTIAERKAPTGLSGGKGQILGTTDEMEYRFAEQSIWKACTNTTTFVSEPGSYFVRYAENNNYLASPETGPIVVSVAVKQPQAAPTGLLGIKPTAEGQKGCIEGTTTAMEYSVNEQQWTGCADGYTELTPGQYYVRLKETATHDAGASAKITVPEFSFVPPAPQTGILSIFNGSVLAKELSQSNIDALRKITNTYSSYNTWPSYNVYPNVSGVEVMDLLSAAGLNPSGSSEITFYAADGFNATLRAADLTATRYFFSSNGSRSSSVPAVISFDADSSGLYFGQLVAQEQTNQAFVKMVDRIVVGGSAGSWGKPTASPDTSIKLKKGDPIRLSGASGEAKIYYTLDGSNPTMESTMYNVTAERWFGQKGMTDHPPINAPSDEEFTVKARIMGLGRSDGDMVTFTYNSDVTPQPKSGGESVVIKFDATNMGDTPVIGFKASDLSGKITEAVAGGNSGILELQIKAADTATSVEIQIPAASIKEMIDSGLTAFIINSPLGYITYDQAALKSLYSQGEGITLDFRIIKVNPKTLDEALQAVVGNNQLYQIQVLRKGAPIESFGAGQASIRLFYKLQAGESAYGVKAWHISDNAVVTELQSTYNSTQGYVQFVRGSHSYYMVGYDAAAAVWTDNPFTDVGINDWFYDNIRFVYERGLMTGTADNTFSPHLSTTRGAIVTILWRLEGQPEAQGSSFGDVSAEAYYANAVAWAATHGIVNGVDDTRFSPDGSITRQQLAAILYRYAQYKGYSVSAKESIGLSIFTDADTVADYASEAMQWACGIGMLQGSENRLEPQGRATRAQVAAILDRFIKGVAE